MEISQDMMENAYHPLGISDRRSTIWTYKKCFIGKVRRMSRCWGHTHTRVNQYTAVLTIQPVDGVWKITNLELIEEKRVS